MTDTGQRWESYRPMGKLLTYEEAVEATGRDRRTLHRWVADADVRLGLEDGIWRLSSNDLDRMKARKRRRKNMQPKSCI